MVDERARVFRDGVWHFTCVQCGKPSTGKRRDKRFCSHRCAERARRGVPPEADSPLPGALHDTSPPPPTGEDVFSPFPSFSYWSRDQIEAVGRELAEMLAGEREEVSMTVDLTTAQGLILRVRHRFRLAGDGSGAVLGTHTEA